MKESRPLRVFLSVGEVSGDVLGARLMAALRAQAGRPVEFRGLGGEAMAAEGLESLFPLSELAVMGLVEIVPHIPRLKRRIAETAEAVREFAPDVLVTVDAPGFNKRLADACGPADFPKVHYVAPTVWAWRKGRVHKFKKRFDRLLCLLPFEPPYFEAVGLPADFVGHSILESGADRGDGPGFRTRHGIAQDARLLCVLPGSRRGEIERLLPVFRDAIERLVERVGPVSLVMPSVPHLAATIEEAVALWPIPVTVLKGGAEKYDAMAASDAALAASGTVALELALARVPTVIAYRLNALTHWIVRRLVNVDKVHLLNIMADRFIVPEEIQSDCTPERLASDLAAMLSGEGAAQAEALSPYLRQLAPENGTPPSQAAAAAILSSLP